MLDSTDRTNIPLSRHAYVRFVSFGAPNQTRAFTTRLTTLDQLPTEYNYIAESRSFVILGIWVDGIGRLNGYSAETFVRTVARRVTAAEGAPTRATT